MLEIIQSINWETMFDAVLETVYMSVTSLIIATILGFVLGIVLYITQDGGLYPNKIVNGILDFIINIFRAVPSIISLFILEPFTKILDGTILGAKAALPAHIISSEPFYARMCLIS